MKAKLVIQSAPGILGGTTVFLGVKREQVIAVLEQSREKLLRPA